MYESILFVVLFTLSIGNYVITPVTMVIGLKQCPIPHQLSLFFCLYTWVGVLIMHLPPVWV